MSKKIWRVNLSISYLTEIADPQTYGMPIHSILEHLAWLYKLDYAKEVEYQLDFGEDTHSAKQLENYEFDIFHFRSTEKTKISSKDFRQLIGNVFYSSRLFSEGVEVDLIMQKHLSQYPFPDEFYRPLKFPFVEYHKGSQISLKMQSAALELVFQEEKDLGELN